MQSRYLIPQKEKINKRCYITMSDCLSLVLRNVRRGGAEGQSSHILGFSFLSEGHRPRDTSCPGKFKRRLITADMVPQHSWMFMSQNKPHVIATLESSVKNRSPICFVGWICVAPRTEPRNSHMQGKHYLGARSSSPSLKLGCFKVTLKGFI